MSATAFTDRVTDPGDADRDSMRRALRDLEAAETRVQKNAERVYDETRSKLVVELLPVLDDLDRTLAAADPDRDRALVDGVRMIRARLETVLLRYGVERVDGTGQRFDPAVHEAIVAVPVTDPRQDRLVLEQLEPGYRFVGRVLRPARVTVGVLGAR